MRNLKIMGLALVAVLAMSAMVASAASAASYKSEFTTGATELTGESSGNHVFQTTAAKVVCTKATGSGKFTSPATSITAESIVYSGCTVAGQAATVNMNGCSYTFGTPSGTESPFTVAGITINCASGKEIVVTATTSGCTIKVPAQSTTGTSTAANNAGPPKTVTVNANVSKISATGSGGICGSGATTATYTGAFNVKGFSDAAHSKATGIFIG